MQAVIKKLAGMVVIAALVGLGYFAFQPVPVDVDVRTVQDGTLQLTVNAEGKTRLKERYIVSSPLAGHLLRIHHRPGDTVVEGETQLAVVEPNDPSLIDPREKKQLTARKYAAEAAKEKAKALLKQSQSASELANTVMKRARDLHAGGSFSDEELDLAEAKARIAADEVEAAKLAVRVAEYEYKHAQAALVRASRDQSAEASDQFDILSPISGLVLRVFEENAGVISSGTKLIELGNLRDLELEIDVFSSDAVKITPGSKVIIDHWGGLQPLYGRVRVVEPSGFLKVSALGVEEQRVNVICDFTGEIEDRQGLGDAYRVEAKIVVGEAEGLLVPSSAVFRHQDGFACYTVRSGRADLVPVEVGLSNGIETVIVNGLAAGDRVIDYPSERVAPGVAVRERERR